MKHTLVATAEAFACAAVGVLAAAVIVISCLIRTGRGTLP